MLQEIEAEASRCRSYVEPDDDGRIDLNQLLSALRIKLSVKSEREMEDNQAYSDAEGGQIVCRRHISSGLRFGDPTARYVVAHELGHFFLHRGSARKPRKLSGNKTLPFIAEDESAENQAWKFARALLIPRTQLKAGETDEALGIRLGLPTGAATLRREEVAKAIKTKQPKVVPPSVTAFLRSAHRSSNASIVARSNDANAEKHKAWIFAARIEGEDPAMVRSARGFRVEWDAHGRYDSQVGWTIRNGEVRSFMDLRSG
jgi:hypothetical protein